MSFVSDTVDCGSADTSLLSEPFGADQIGFVDDVLELVVNISDSGLVHLEVLQWLS